MSATIPLRARRRWTNLYLSAFFALAGCGSGVVEPIVAAVTADAGDAGDPERQLDFDAASDEGRKHAGRTYCEDVDADWPESAGASEGAVFGILNGLRYDPPEVCQRTAERVWYLRPGSSELRCVARLGASQRTISADAADANAPPIFVRNNDQRDIDDREERAGIRDGAVRLELLIMNAEGPDEIYEHLLGTPADACLALDPGFVSVGIAQRGNFWVLDFAGSSGPPPRRQ